MKSKAAKINGGTITNYMIVIIMVIVLFQALAALFPTLITAGTALNASGFPLGSLFLSGGAAWYILAAAVILLLIKSLMGSKK